MCAPPGMDVEGTLLEGRAMGRRRSKRARAGCVTFGYLVVMGGIALATAALAFGLVTAGVWLLTDEEEVLGEVRRLAAREHGATGREESGTPDTVSRDIAAIFVNQARIEATRPRRAPAPTQLPAPPARPTQGGAVESARSDADAAEQDLPGFDELELFGGPR